MLAYSILLALFLVIAVLPAAASRWLHLVAMSVSLAVGQISLTLGLRSLVAGDGIRAAMFFVLGAAALWASVSDLRKLRSRGVRRGEKAHS